MSAGHYDLIVIGTGPGGAALAQRLAPSGKSILMIERGDYLPRSLANWDAKIVFSDLAYQAEETWYDKKGNPFHPGLHYFVGGNSKVYGAALLRLRERDFDSVRHSDGLSPAWPLMYEDFEPYYAQAERVFHVHGQRGEDPTEPSSREPYPYLPVSHEPLIQNLHDSLTRIGLHPFHLPLGVLFDEKNGEATPTSIWFRNDVFDGFPCPLNGKADAQVMCIDPMLKSNVNVTLLTNACVTRLLTDPSGKKVDRVEVAVGEKHEQYSADIVVVACGALSSALLLLRSANDHHPNGLANGSDQVGRNYMRHNQSVLMALTRELNKTVFQKTFAISDFYFGSDDWDYPLGLIQTMGRSHAYQISAEILPDWLSWFPEMPFDAMARHSLDFWLMSEDLPRPENRIRIDHDGRVILELTENNMKAHHRLRSKLKQIMGEAYPHPALLDRKIYFSKNIPIEGTAHQAGTARFGTDPATSVLDVDCKAHELDNLYVVDGSFFPSIGAVNPTLTIIANALRVADKIAARMSAIPRFSEIATEGASWTG